MTAGRVVVIGGGVIGATCAYYLRKAGRDVTILDRGAIGRGCSHANCGLVSPSHALPLTVPGAAWKAFKSLFRRNAPFSVRPRLDPALWLWLYRFARRCNVADMTKAGRAIHALLRSSIQLYHGLMASEPLDCEWEPRGLMFVFQTPAQFEAYAETDRILRYEFDEPAVRFDRTALTQFEPALKPGLAGAWYYEADAHLRPDKLMASWRNVLQRDGVNVHEQRGVNGFQITGTKARAVATDDDEITGDQFLIALGAWSPQLAQSLNCRLPIQPGKGYSMTMARPAKCPSRPIMFPEHSVAVTPMQSVYRLGSTMEFGGYNDRLDTRRLALLTEGARQYLIEPTGEPVLEEWCGLRPMTYDSVPIIGQIPGIDNIWVAAGHNMLGLSMAPGTGKLVAELMTGLKPHIDPNPYSITRF